MRTYHPILLMPLIALSLFLCGCTPGGPISQAPREEPPLSAGDFNTRGLSYHSQKKYEAAIEMFTKAVQVNPHYSPAYNNLGNSYREKGMQKEALEAYQ